MSKVGCEAAGNAESCEAPAVLAQQRVKRRLFENSVS